MEENVRNQMIGDAQAAAMFAMTEMGVGEFCGRVALAMRSFIRTLRNKSWSESDLDVILSIAIDTYIATHKASEKA